MTLDPAGLTRIRQRIGEIADHDSLRCTCHPVEWGCCSRVKLAVRITPAMIDALDSIRFAWHVGTRCTVRPDAHARVLPGMPAFWIGGPGWWLRSTRALQAPAE